MGKSLIIKGADFSANAIPSADSELFNACSEAFTVGTGIAAGHGSPLKAESNTARASIWGIDLSGYYVDGYRQLRIKTKSAYLVVLITGTSIAESDWNTWDANGNPGDWNIGWGTGEYLGTIPSNTPKLWLNIKRADNAVIDESVTFTDVIQSLELI